jgi:ElaB/YqjD/DUF883 family membrane-anchored ribosome-binding protein
MNTTEQSSDTRDKLIADLKLVIKDAEELLRNSGQQVGQQMDATYQAARERFQSTLQNARSGLGTAQDRMMSSSKDMMETTHAYVQENPWQSVGIGAVAGLLIGFLLSRK